MRVAYATGDPRIVVVISQQDVTTELFVRLEVGCLSLGTAEVKDGSTKLVSSVVLDVTEEGFGRSVVLAPVRLGTESFLLLVDLTRLTEGESLLTDIGSTVR